MPRAVRAGNGTERRLRPHLCLQVNTPLDAHSGIRGAIHRHVVLNIQCQGLPSLGGTSAGRGDASSDTQRKYKTKERRIAVNESSTNLQKLLDAANFGDNTDIAKLIDETQLQQLANDNRPNTSMEKIYSTINQIPAGGHQLQDTVTQATRCVC